MPMLMLLDTIIGLIEEFLFGDGMSTFSKLVISIGIIMIIVFTVQLVGVK